MENAPSTASSPHDTLILPILGALKRAGYALYGPATMLVWTAGDGVNAFVLEREVGEFVLWREKIRMRSCQRSRHGTIPSPWNSRQKHR